MASSYFVEKGGKTYGPVSSSDLKKLAQSGKLAPSDLVWKEGSKKKTRAEQVKGLSLKSPVVVAPPPAQDDDLSALIERVSPALLSSASTKLRPLKPKTSQTPPGPAPSAKTKPGNSNDGSSGTASIALWAFIGVFVLGIGLFMGWNLSSSHIVQVGSPAGASAKNNDPPGRDLIGKWKSNSFKSSAKSSTTFSFVFNDDGTGTLNTSVGQTNPFKWSVNENNLTCITDDPDSKPLHYEYSVSGDILKVNLIGRNKYLIYDREGVPTAGSSSVVSAKTTDPYGRDLIGKVGGSNNVPLADFEQIDSLLEPLDNLANYWAWTITKYSKNSKNGGGWSGRAYCIVGVMRDEAERKQFGGLTDLEIAFRADGLSKPGWDSPYYKESGYWALHSLSNTDKLLDSEKTYQSFDGIPAGNYTNIPFKAYRKDVPSTGPYATVEELINATDLELSSRTGAFLVPYSAQRGWYLREGVGPSPFMGGVFYINPDDGSPFKDRALRERTYSTVLRFAWPWPTPTQDPQSAGRSGSTKYYRGPIKTDLLIHVGSLDIVVWNDMSNIGHQDHYIYLQEK